MRSLRLLFIVLSFCISSVSVFSQICFTGGTGADGAYNASSNTSIPGGTYNYTTFNIDAGVTVNVTGTQPLIIYCTGAVTISGTLSANGGNGTDGITSGTNGIAGVAVAGGHNGGDGVYSSSTGPLSGIAGSGPGGTNNQGDGWSGGGGGGFAAVGDSSHGVGGFGGPLYGDAIISVIDGGSGGGGGSGGYSCGGGGGGAGGGVIIINSEVGITIGASGMISCKGGNGGSDGTGNCGGGGGGSGGVVYLASPSVTNNGSINCAGGNGGASNVPGNPYYGGGANGSAGRIKIDHSGSILGSGTTTPAIGSNAPLNIANIGYGLTTNDTVCSGTSVTYIGTGGVSYVWTGGITDNVAFIATSSDVYTVTGTDINGCTNTASSTLTVLPSPTVSLGADVVQPTPPVILDAGAGFSSYLWNNTATTQTISVSTNGTYIVTVTNSDGCADSDTIQVNFTAGINSSDENISLQLYPNPSDGNLFLHITSLNNEPVLISVMDLTGKTMYNQSKAILNNELNTMLHLNELTNGVYILSVHTKTNHFKKRFVINK